MTAQSILDALMMATWQTQASAPASEWVHASNLAPDRLMEIASAVGIPHVLIEAALHESSYPRIETGARRRG